MKFPYWALPCALLLIQPAFSEEKEAPDCAVIYRDVKEAVSKAPDTVLELVAQNVAASADCSCEIVKAAIEAAKPDAEGVAAIVRAAATAAPEKMRLIAQCAIAVAPDALGQVQAVLAELDPNGSSRGGDSKDSKGFIDDSKDAKEPLKPEVASMGDNPLNRAPQSWAAPMHTPIFISPITNVNPVRPLGLGGKHHKRR